MEFTCPQCHTLNYFDIERASKPNLAVKCSACGFVNFFRDNGEYLGGHPDSSQASYDYSSSFPSGANPSFIENDWFYSANGENFGPYSLEALRLMFFRGELGSDVHVWHEMYRAEGWQLVGDVEIFRDVLADSRYGSSLPPRSMISEAFESPGLAEITAGRNAQPDLRVDQIYAIRRKLKASSLADTLRASISSSHPSVTADSPTVPEAATPSQSRQSGESQGASSNNLRATRVAADKIAAQLGGSSSSAAGHSPITPEAPDTEGLSPRAKRTSLTDFASSPGMYSQVPYQKEKVETLPQSTPFKPQQPQQQPQEIGPSSGETLKHHPSNDRPVQNTQNQGFGASQNAAPRTPPGSLKRPQRPSQPPTTSDFDPGVLSQPEPAPLLKDQTPFPPLEPKAEKKSKIPLILIILFLLAAAGAALYYFVLAPKPEENQPVAEVAADAQPEASPKPEEPPSVDENRDEETGLVAPVPEENESSDSDDTPSPSQEEGSDAKANLNGVFENARFANGGPDEKKSRPSSNNDQPKVLTMERALEGIRKVSKSVELCRERFVRRGGEFTSEKIDISLTVLGTGDVEKIGIVPTELEGTEFSRCMNSQRPRWKFYATGGPPQKVQRTFVIQ